MDASQSPYKPSAEDEVYFDFCSRNVRVAVPTSHRSTCDADSTVVRVQFELTTDLQNSCKVKLSLRESSGTRLCIQLTEFKNRYAIFYDNDKRIAVFDEPTCTFLNFFETRRLQSVGDSCSCLSMEEEASLILYLVSVIAYIGSLISIIIFTACTERRTTFTEIYYATSKSDAEVEEHSKQEKDMFSPLLAGVDDSCLISVSVLQFANNGVELGKLVLNVLLLFYLLFTVYDFLVDTTNNGVGDDTSLLGDQDDTTKKNPDGNSANGARVTENVVENDGSTGTMKRT